MKGRDVELVQVDIDISNVANEFYDDDQIGIYAPKTRNDAGQITSTALKVVPLTAGKASVKLKPGPVVVRFMCQGVADTREHAGWVPDTGPVSLADVIPQWTPALVDQGVLKILVALDEALSQVDDAVAAELTNNTTYVISTGTNVHANKVVRLDENGKLRIGTSSVTSPNEPVPLALMQLELSKKSGTGHKHIGSDIVNGTTQYVNYTDDRFADQIVRLDAEGRLHVTTEGITKPTDVINVQFAQTLVTGALDEALSQVDDAVAAELTNNTTYVISTGTNVHANKVVRLDENGKLRIGTSSVTSPNEPVPLALMQAELSKKSSADHKHNAGDIVNGTTQYVNYTDDRFADQIVRLDAEGRLHVTTEGITKPTDVINVQFAQALVTGEIERKLSDVSGSGQTSWWN